MIYGISYDKWKEQNIESPHNNPDITLLMDDVVEKMQKHNIWCTEHEYIYHCPRKSTITRYETQRDLLKAVPTYWAIRKVFCMDLFDKITMEWSTYYGIDGFLSSGVDKEEALRYNEVNVSKI